MIVIIGLFVPPSKSQYEFGLWIMEKRHFKVEEHQF